MAFATGAFLTFLGTLGSLGFQWAGLSKQEKQAKRTERLGMRMRQEDIAREDKRYGMEYRIRRKEMKEAKEERAKEWEWREDERDYVQSQNVVNGFLGLLDRDPASKDRLMMTWNNARVK